MYCVFRQCNLISDIYSAVLGKIQSQKCYMYVIFLDVDEILFKIAVFTLCDLNVVNLKKMCSSFTNPAVTVHVLQLL